MSIRFAAIGFDHPLPFGVQLLNDLVTREETAITQAHTFTVSELALQAQAMANG